VDKRALAAVLLVPLLPWAWRVVLGLWEELRQAAEPLDLPEIHGGIARPRRDFLDTRAPLNRVLAFRGVAQRQRARSRWEAGFGRRGL